MLDSVGGSPRLAFLCHLYLGWRAYEAGDARTTEAEAAAALDLPVGPELRAAGLALRSCVERRRGELDLAVSTAVTTLALERDSRDHELTEGFPALALGVALTATGDRRAAHAALTMGRARLIAIAATIASPTQRAAFLLRPLPNASVMALAQKFDHEA